MRLLALFVFATSLIGCAADAQQHHPGPVTAGPSQSVFIDPGGEAVVTLERATDPLAVVQSDGLVVPAQPTLVSARLGLRGGKATAVVQLGPRGGPWRTVAMAADPPTLPPLLVYPEPGDLVRVVASSARGAELLGSDAGPRLTWVTATPLDP